MRLFMRLCRHDDVDHDPRSLPRTVTRAILARDQGICNICGQPGADTVDHVVNVKSGGTDDPANTRACHARPCHAAKTARESAAARARIERPKARRDPEPHPGTLR
jgi:5-methylcytosine-specific restriction enzyme A